MNIKDGYISKKVTFQTQDGLEEKIDRLTLMMSKLTAQDDSQNKQFKPKIYQSKRKGQIRNFYNRCNYDQRIYQNRYRSNSGDRRIYSVAEYNMGRIIEIVLGIIRNYRNYFRTGNFRSNLRSNQNYRGQNLQWWI